MKSFKKPTQQQVDAAVQRMRSPAFAAYFLSRLENPKWIDPLSDRGLFANPPPTGHWPASRYLSRMVSHAPSEVAAVFRRFETNNPLIVRDILDAAMAMPVKVALKLIPQVGRAVRLEPAFNLIDASELCVRLADDGEMESAMALVDQLFTPELDGERGTSRQDLHWYKKSLKKVMPTFVGRLPEVFLGKLCEWLRVSLDAKKHVDPQTGEDDSCWWRPAIENHDQNRGYDFAGELVGLVREGFETAIRDGHLSFDEAIQIIERYPYLVFKRVRLHLINEFAAKQPDRAQAAILDRGLFDNYRFKHEYAMLVGRRFNLLSAEDQQTWFGWIDDGPDMTHFDESLGRDATDEERRNRIRWWQYEKLHLVRNFLEEDRREFYGKMLAEHGEPELADLNVRFRSGFGIPSPMTVDELSEMTFQEAVETVSSWKPEERGFMTPDIEGLASTFEQYVTSSPEEFSAQADVLMDRPAIYVRGFISQMGQEVAAGRDIDIDAVLGLCKWVVGRPIEERTTPASNRDALVDKDWQWTRKDIAEFIKHICHATSDAQPKYLLEKYREPLWGLLELLSRDRAESYVVRDVSQEDPRLHEYLQLGINSPRGKAIEATLEYMRWVANHIKHVDGDREVVTGGFGAIPEFREMLEWQIALENRSVEVMAVIGSQIDLINWVDNRWLADNADRLFDLQGIERKPQESCGWAAWNAFLVWVGPHFDYYRMFRSQFIYAVDQAEKVELTEETHEQPMNDLTRHLVVLFGRGQLGLDDDGGLLRKFVTRSNPEIRRTTVGFVGQSLNNSEKVSDDIVERFMTLWEIYWSDVGKKDAADKPGSYLFGPWFSCGQFPDEWAMAQLEQFVEVSPIVEPDDAVVERLAEIANINAARAVRILDLMVKGDQEGWRVYGWIDGAREILQKAMNTKGDARAVAARLIDYLARRGYTQLGDLLT